MYVRDISEIGNIGRSARMFVKVRRDVGLTQVEMSKIVGLSQMRLSFVEQGKHQPMAEHCRRLRNLAFHQKLPYAAEVFPEHDDPDLKECPMCVSIRKYRRLQGLDADA